MYIATKRDGFDEPLSSDLSHIILQLAPSDESRRLETCDYEPVSRWVVDTLLEAYETREAGAIAEFYRNLSRKSWAATFRDCLFERQVLTYLKTNRNLPIRGLANPKTTTWTYRGHNGLFTFLDDQTAVDGIKNAVETKTSLHLVPSIPNFPAVDSIVYDPNEVLTCIQITIDGNDHPIALSGLERIQTWLKPSTLAANLHPNKRRRWRFIFIVPSEMAPDFTLQALDGKDKAQVDEWAGQVDQYVLGLKEETIFRGISAEQSAITPQQGEQPVRC